MSYAQQRYLSIALTIILAGLTLILAANPADYGLSPVAARWLSVVGGMIGVALGFLPSARGMGRDPEFLANRVSELPAHDRAMVIGDVQERVAELKEPHRG